MNVDDPLKPLGKSGSVMPNLIGLAVVIRASGQRAFCLDMFDHRRLALAAWCDDAGNVQSKACSAHEIAHSQWQKTWAPPAPVHGTTLVVAVSEDTLAEIAAKSSNCAGVHANGHG